MTNTAYSYRLAVPGTSRRAVVELHFIAPLRQPPRRERAVFELDRLAEKFLLSLFHPTADGGWVDLKHRSICLLPVGRLSKGRFPFLCPALFLLGTFPVEQVRKIVQHLLIVADHYRVNLLFSGGLIGLYGTTCRFHPTNCGGTFTSIT